MGEQYAWGEIEIKSDYSEENSLWQGKECEDIGGHPEFDVATAKWGEHWRLPSHEQIKELDEKCKWVYTKKNGVRGFIIIGPNGKKYFYLLVCRHPNGHMVHMLVSIGALLLIKETEPM